MFLSAHEVFAVAMLFVELLSISHLVDSCLHDLVILLVPTRDMPSVGIGTMMILERGRPSFQDDLHDV